MKFHIVAIFFLVFTNTIIFSQINSNSGAISTSMAGLNASNDNIWSINNNIGQLSNLETTCASLSVYQPFMLSDFTTAGLAFGLPTESGVFGLSYSNYGNKYLQFHTAGLGYSMLFNDNFSGGVKLSLVPRPILFLCQITIKSLYRNNLQSPC